MLRYSDLNKTRDLVSEEKIELDKNMTEELKLKAVQHKIEELMETDYCDFIRAMITIEKGVNDLDILNKVYERYMEEDYIFHLMKILNIMKNL